MDFETYRKARKKQETDQSATPDEIRKTAERYVGKNDEEMLGEILSAAKKEKRDGTYSDARIDEFVGAVSPMLNEEQRERLQKAIRMIKGN